MPSWNKKKGFFFFFTALNTFFFFFKIFEQERQFLQNTVHHLTGKLLQNRALPRRKGRKSGRCGTAVMPTRPHTFLQAQATHKSKQLGSMSDDLISK